jgi:hypothetical protein
MNLRKTAKSDIQQWNYPRLPPTRGNNGYHNYKKRRDEGIGPSNNPKISSCDIEATFLLIEST